MKIAIVSKSTKIGGGASKVAEDLTNLLNQNGHHAHHYRRDLASGYTKNSTSVYGKWEKFAKKTYFKLKYFGFQEIIPFELFHLLNEIKIHKYDLIHFHDLSTAISPYTLMYLSNKVPVVWTFHDCSPFTGGCIYPMDCEKYKLDCKECPQKNDWPMGGKFDLASFYLKIKKTLHKKNLHLISPSKWLKNLANDSLTIKNNISIIPNGVDTSIYKPLDKKESKELFNIPNDRFTILITAHNINSVRKGFTYALETIKKLKELNPYLILVGKIDKKTEHLIKDFDFYSSGFISEYEELNKLYNASDIFLNCSLADNLPLVILETMAAGTPTFGFKTGGMPEMIEQNINGYLVENYDTTRLSSEISHAVLNKKLMIHSKNSREIALKKYHKDIFLNTHLEFYNSLLTNPL